MDTHEKSLSLAAVCVERQVGGKMITSFSVNQSTSESAGEEVLQSVSQSANQQDVQS